MSTRALLETTKAGSAATWAPGRPSRLTPTPSQALDDRPPTPGPGHDFSRIPVAQATPTADSCPLRFTPTRCPFGGACHTCTPRVQAKLAISQPGDEYEREADRVAEQVMRMPEPPVPKKPTAPEQRKHATYEEEQGLVHLDATQPSGFSPEYSAVVPIVHEVLRSPGKPLDADTRAFLEPRFGHDFSNIRVHHDPREAESARLLDANAYTAGSHVVFGRDRYAPRSANGIRLLAHELTHAVQQRAGGNALPLPIGGNDTAAEHETRELVQGSRTTLRPVQQLVARQIQRDVDDPGRMATTHESLFISAPGAGGGAQRPWQDATATTEGTAAEMIRQAKAAVQHLTGTDPGAVGGSISTRTTEANLDADAVVANARVRQRFPQITVSVSDRQITDAVSVLSPAITSDLDFLHQWLANMLIGWTDIELYDIRETDPRFVAMLDALLADTDVGADLRTLATRQSGFQRGEGTSREIAVHHGTPAAQRRLTLIHELVHFYAHDTYRAWVDGTTDSRFFNEGFTEWLAQRVMTAAERTNRGGYSDQVAAIDQHVAAHVSEDDIARAFFNGAVWRIESRSTIARREFAAASGIRESARTREETSDSRSGPGLNQEIVPGVRYRFLNLGHDRAEPKPEHVSFFSTLKLRHIDPDIQTGVRFAGYASSSGSVEHNEQLSLQRALAFYRMARNTGVADAQLLDARNPAHFGETRPTVTEEDAETRAFNRRVEMSLIRAATPTRNPDEPTGG